MWIRRKALLLLACAMMVLPASCTMAPVLNLENEILPTKVDGEPYTQEEVRQAILRACNRRGWSAQVQDDGTILASVLVRTHTAKVQIAHTNTQISITYLDSHDLDYYSGQIHRNYNRWVANLFHSIQYELGSRGQMY